ncbi:TatD family hydrolase [Cerasicoccus maritimus]|uniref:TatD family hydrolase n=1 Tax=Cerasicoccus maritimus TaxID=490089 RepID=UPI002852BE31|nr:TatD family hydrolase [Cerasicoccus maritimus]
MSQPPLYDAHCHWHDARLLADWPAIEAALSEFPLGRVVVNGTHPGDWPAVAELAKRDPRVIPAFGLHPWRVNDAPADWLQQLEDFLTRFPHAAVGEVGLDRWIVDHDLPRQQEAFRAQLKIAARDNSAVSIHCLQAWGPLLDTLQTAALPARGFHLHGYGGSPEMVPTFAQLGAYFSFSAYVMHERKTKHRASLLATPPDRLLLETDCPDMLPPEDWQDFTLAGNVAFAHAPEGEPRHHPANIAASYRAAAELLNLPAQKIREQVAENFRRFFGEA